MSDIRSRAVPAQVRPRDSSAFEGTDLSESLRMMPAPRRSSREYLQLRAEALQCALTQPVVASHEEPGELVSLANRRGISVQAMHAKKRSIKAQREMGERIARTFAATAGAGAGRILMGLDAGFLVIVITRIAPRSLDSDNLEANAKGVRDGIAAGLGIDDRSSLVRYVVSQEQGAPRECRVRAELHIQPKEQS